MQRGVSIAGALCTLLACGDGASPSSDVPGVLTERPQDVLEQLPPLLRDRFDTSAGKQELERALEDKARLYAEARARKIHERPEIREQVEDLELRLSVQALLKDELKTRPVAEAQMRTFWQENPHLFTKKERAKIGRVFVQAAGDDRAALRRIEALRARLKKGEPLSLVVKDSDGAERATGGELGWIAADYYDAALAKAALALEQGELSQIEKTAGGYSVILVHDKQPAGIEPFESSKAAVIARMQPTLERRAFDALIGRLRQQGEKNIEQKQAEVRR